MKARIAERVWPAWREQVEKWDEPSLLLLFSPVGDPGEAAVAVRASVLEVQAAFDEAAERSGAPDPPFVGEWDWVRVSEGVLVHVVECDMLEEMLPAVAAALERRGIEGVFDLGDRSTVATPPTTAHFVECRLRVRGGRLRHERRAYFWEADAEAHEAVLAVADRWCRANRPGATHSLSSGTIGPIEIEPDEDVLERMRAEVVDKMHVEVSVVTAAEFRSVAARAWAGGVSLVVGGARVEAGEWRRPLAELTALLRDHADLLAYGYVRRGWAVKEALLAPSLSFDWPRRAEDEPRGIAFTSQAFEDLYAPDAFGIQLLGPGYVDRIPESTTWRTQPAGENAVLLEHVDLPPWLDAPFVPFGQRPRNPDELQPPAVLTQARYELASILYSPGVLKRAGFADAEE